MSIGILGWIVMGGSSTRLQALSPVCRAAGSRLGAITFEGNCFSYKYRRNSSSCQNIHSVVETVLVSSGHSSWFSSCAFGLKS